MKHPRREPEKYRDLVVRIAGYPAYFIELSTDCRNDVISRNENMLKGRMTEMKKRRILLTALCLCLLAGLLCLPALAAEELASGE